MKDIFFRILLMIVIGSSAMSAQTSKDIPTPALAQLAWQNAELVTVSHYDLHVFDGKNYNQQKNRVTRVSDVKMVKLWGVVYFSGIRKSYPVKKNGVGVFIRAFKGH